MTLWIDGDSCHKEAMEVSLNVHKRGRIQLVVVADRIIPGVEDAGADMVLVPHGSGEVDDRIVNDSSPGDIAVTRDFLLGIRLVEKGVTVLNDRGKIWSLRALKERAEEAELMIAIRSGGMGTQSFEGYSAEERHAFASTLDRIVNSPLSS